MNDDITLHGNLGAISLCRIRVDHNVVDRQLLLLLLLLLLHLLIELRLLHLVVAALQICNHSWLLLLVLLFERSSSRRVKLGGELRIHELTLARVHIHRRHHHLGHVLLMLRGKLVLLSLVSLAARRELVLVHATCDLLHIIDLLLLVLQEEWVCRLRHLI